MRKLTIIAAFLAATSIAQEATAAEPFTSLASNCSSCHAISSKDVAKAGLDHLWTRKGPDLFFAGQKFNRDWLVSWLQNPTHIRPAGILPARVAQPTDGSDIVPAAALPKHPELSKADAEKAADALMALKEEDAIAAGAYGGKGNLRFGQLAFTKLRGCSACHQYASDKGGVSGPELFTAGARLQPDFIASYIKKPQEIQPGIWMPAIEMTDQDIKNLTTYLLSLGAEAKK